jgi:hypothetical protein
MSRRQLEARLARIISRRFMGGPLDLPNYASRRSRRHQEWRLARLLSGGPALVDEAATEAPALASVELLLYRGAA